jgi:hypothetical protein
MSAWREAACGSSAACVVAALAFGGCGGDGGGSAAIDTRAEARAYLAEAIRGRGGGDAVVSADAPPTVEKLVDRARKIADVHAVADRSHYVGWICDGLDLYRDDERLIGPTSSELRIAMIDSDRYSVSERGLADRILANLDPDGPNGVTLAEGTRLFKSLEGGLCERLGPTSNPNPRIR